MCQRWLKGVGGLWRGGGGTPGSGGFLLSFYMRAHNFFMLADAWRYSATTATALQQRMASRMAFGSLHEFHATRSICRELLLVCVVTLSLTQ